MNNIISIIILLFFVKLNGQNVGSGVTDIDGNYYNTVIIGDQEWMSENLKTTKYCNGDQLPINNNLPDGQWGNLTVGAWNYSPYPNNEKLYNWYAAADQRNICPCNWHVPSDSEWTVLENYLITNGFNYDGTTIGNKIAKAMATQIDYWENSFNEGAIGNNIMLNNSSGFNAFPSGTSLIQFGYIPSIYTFWWSTNEWSTNTTYAIWRGLKYNNSYLMNGAPDIGEKTSGFSIRCIKNSSLNNENIINSSFYIYPIPTENYININLPIQDLPCEYYIYDLTGKKIKFGAINTENTILNASELQKGLYFFTIFNNTKSITQKFIKN